MFSLSTALELFPLLYKKRPEDTLVSIAPNLEVPNALRELAEKGMT